MKLLNVGGGSKRISLPDSYADWEHVLLDIADGPDVDIVMDTRDMDFEEEFDAVYCSHNLEHYPAHSVPDVLSKFLRAVKTGGHVDIRVPNLEAMIRVLAENDYDLDRQLYVCDKGPVTIKDVIFGFGVEIEESGDAWGHKTGFTPRTLQKALEEAGFSNVQVRQNTINLHAIAWKGAGVSEFSRVITSPKITVTPASVIVGYAHNGHMRQEFHQSLTNMGHYDSLNSKHIFGESSAGGPYITHNRNLVCDQALGTPTEWLFMVDNDVEFPNDILDRMLEVADPVIRPIVGALYFTKMTEHWLPVWLEDVEGVGMMPVEQITIGEVREVSALGMGCTLIHRSVLEKMKTEYANDPWHWFNHDLIDGEYAGEDVTFCHRAKKMGIKIHGFAYPLVHMKTYPIDWKTFNDQYRLLALDKKEE